MAYEADPPEPATEVVYSDTVPDSTAPLSGFEESSFPEDVNKVAGGSEADADAALNILDETGIDNNNASIETEADKANGSEGDELTEPEPGNEPQGNSYKVEINKTGLIDGTDTGIEMDFTITFTELAAVTPLGSAKVTMPNLNGNGESDSGFKFYLDSPILIETSPGKNWSGEIIREDAFYYLYLWGNSALDYLGKDESVSATFTAKTPEDNNRGRYEFKTEAWTNADTTLTFGEKTVQVGTIINNMAEDYNDPLVIVGNSISSPEELNNIKTNLADHFIQTGDIDLSGVDNWLPIGNNANPFTGTYHGNDHEINNMKISGTSTNIGLFGETGTNAILLNINLKDIDVRGLGTIGGLAGTNNGIIRFCQVSGAVSGTGHVVGGMVGVNQGTIANSKVDCSVTGIDSVGGMVGENLSDALIVNSSSYGNVTGSNHVGGLAGRNITRSIIKNSFASGDISGNNYIGGLVGTSGSSGTIINSFATGEVMGHKWVGGLAGNNPSGTITKSYASGDVHGSENIGGLVGRNAGTGNINNCYATGNVYGTEGVGGLVGINDKGTIVGDGQIIMNCYSSGNVRGQNKTGALIGYNMSNGIIKNCFSTGSAKDIDGINNVGGFYGQNDGIITGSACLNNMEAQSIATFIKAGWNIEGRDGTLPVLGWEYGVNSTWYMLGTSNPGIINGTPNNIANLQFQPIVTSQHQFNLIINTILYKLDSGLVTKGTRSDLESFKLDYMNLHYLLNTLGYTLSDNDLAAYETVSAIAWAAILSLEVRINEEEGLPTDIAKLLEVYTLARNLLSENKAYLSNKQYLLLAAVLEEIASIVSR